MKVFSSVLSASMYTHDGTVRTAIASHSPRTTCAATTCYQAKRDAVGAPNVTWRHLANTREVVQGLSLFPASWRHNMTSRGIMLSFSQQLCHLHYFVAVEFNKFC